MTIYLHVSLAAVFLSMSLTYDAFSATCTKENILSTPASDFIIHKNSTVTHVVTGLTWKICAEGMGGNHCQDGRPLNLNWKSATEVSAAANAANFGGYSDWRLPNIKELQSIVEISCAGPAINEAVFPAQPSSWFWSSTSLAPAPIEAWGINFGSGYGFTKNKMVFGYVRLVRGGDGSADFDVVLTK